MPVVKKALTEMNIQIANAISDITGVSGMRIIAAILDGERNPFVLADLRDKRVKASREEVARSLEGTWREDLLFELDQALNSYIFIHGQMEECDKRLEGYLKTLPNILLEIPLAGENQPPASKKTKKPKGSKARDNQPRIANLEEELTKICWPRARRHGLLILDKADRYGYACGQNLCSIDGISVITAQTIVAEIGTDMKAFPSEKNFTSWLGLTPGKGFSGGTVVSKGKRKVKNRAAAALRIAATTLLKSDSYLGARYRHLRRQLPSKKAAVKAMARHLGELVYRLFTHGHAWVDRGAAEYGKRRKEIDLARLTSLAGAKGFRLTP
jgi:transposase